jgi:hypothetical protein
MTYANGELVKPIAVDKWEIAKVQKFGILFYTLPILDRLSMACLTNLNVPKPIFFILYLV